MDARHVKEHYRVSDEGEPPTSDKTADTTVEQSEHATVKAVRCNQGSIDSRVPGCGPRRAPLKHQYERDEKQPDSGCHAHRNSQGDPIEFQENPREYSL